MSKTFSLKGRALKLNTAEDVEPYIKELRDNTDVEELILEGNTIGIGASEALAAVLKDKKKLKHANLADIYTGRLREEIPTSLSHLLTALLELPDLHTVNLSDNAFGLLTEAPLVAFLSSHTPLQHLILNNNGLGPFAGTSIAKAITELATKKSKTSPPSPPLQTIVCGRNRLENGSMAAWSKAYSSHPSMRIVRMVQNGIRQEGIEQLLTTGLSSCNKLEILDLQDNTFTLRGANALTSVVTGWSQLQELGIGDSLLGARGGIKLAETLQLEKNTTLKVLRLQYNEIDVTGLKAFKVAVEKALPNLERLELNGNKFSEEDPVVEEIRELFVDRGVGELDDLSDMEEDDEDEDEEDEDEDDHQREDEDEEEKEDDAEEKAERKEKKEDVVKAANEEENENVAQEKDDAVDALADSLSKTSL